MFYWRKASQETAQKAGLPKTSVTARQKLADASMADRCVVKIVLMGQMLVADLSPHNPGTASFLRRVEQTPDFIDLLARTQYSSRISLWDRLVDGDDCSIARGLGLAIANSHLRGLAVQTVRRSGRSADERGDNLVLFGNSQNEIPGLYVDEAFYFDAKSGIEIFPVQFA
jgi:hypothetical protein